MMINEEKTTDFLNRLSNILTNKISPVKTTDNIIRLFASYFNIKKIEFIIRSNNNMFLKDFARDWKIFDNEKSEISYIFTVFAMANGTKFYFNDSEFECDIKEDEQYRISELKTDVNIIYFPLVSNGDVFGIFKLEVKKHAFTKDFFALLNISSKLISGAIANYLLNEQMEVSLNFYKAMKDIAKIIESQYELSYIIPLIGEMIDRFMPNHLIYIFMCKDNGYKLVWPNACKDNAVYKLLNKIDPKTECLISEDLKTGVFPLVNEEKVIGAVAAYGNIDKLAHRDIDYLIQLTRQSGLTIHRANIYAEVLKYATLDALTGLNNRHQFETRLNQEVSDSRRNNSSLCGIMIDADYFKKVNDTYGHAAGDCVLKGIADVIKHEIREYDTACRYGGEEFFIILPRTKLKEAASVAARLRKVIEETKMDISQTGAPLPYIQVTASLGVCLYESSMSAEAFVQKTDKALYEAKSAGRNRVMVI